MLSLRSNDATWIPDKVVSRVAGIIVVGEKDSIIIAGKTKAPNAFISYTVAAATMASVNNIIDRMKKASKGVVDAGAKTMLKVCTFAGHSRRVVPFCNACLTPKSNSML